jgi:hypothetical protein
MAWKNKEKAKIYGAAYYQIHKEKMNAYQVLWYQANKEKRNLQMAAWRKNNPEKGKTLGAAYYRAHTETIKAATAAYYIANSEKVKAKHSAWRKSNPDKTKIHMATRRARKLNAPGRGITSEQWKEIIGNANGICFYCKQFFEKLTLDHVIPLAKEGAHDISNAVAACGYCNSSKGKKLLSEWLH